MKIIIAGIGKLGGYLTQALVNEKNEITIIDTNFEQKQGLINNEDINYIEGNAINAENLMEAGIDKADLLICVMKNDLENVMCALLGKSLGVKNTIVRIRNQEYENSLNIVKETLGLSMTINPDRLTASKISLALSVPSALDATSVLKGKINVISLKISKESVLKKLTLKTLARKLENNIIVCGIERNGEKIIPNGDTELQEGDKIHIIGTKKDINSFLKFAKLISKKTKNVIIGGGSNTAVYLSQSLVEMGMNVKIIEQSESRCKELSEIVSKVEIIKGDVSIQQTLYEEGIKDCHAFVALTSIDEENLVYSMFASHLNVPKVITKINHINLDGVTEKANIDTVIMPHTIVASQILQYIRAVKKSGNSSCEAIYNFGDSLFEMVEFKVKEDFKKIGVKLKNIKLKENILIGAIQRGKNILYPNGNDEIRLNDTVLIINKDNSLRELNDMVK